MANKMDNEKVKIADKAAARNQKVFELIDDVISNDWPTNYLESSLSKKGIDYISLKNTRFDDVFGRKESRLNVLEFTLAYGLVHFLDDIGGAPALNNVFNVARLVLKAAPQLANEKTSSGESPILFLRREKVELIESLLGASEHETGRTLLTDEIDERILQIKHVDKLIVLLTENGAKLTKEERAALAASEEAMDVESNLAELKADHNKEIKRIDELSEILKTTVRPSETVNLDV